MRDARAALTPRRQRLGPAVVPAAFVLIDAALLATMTFLIVEALYSLGGTPCGPPTCSHTGVDRSGPVSFAGIGAGLIALHLAVAVGLLLGRSAARRVGMVLGLLWLAICVPVGFTMTAGASDGYLVWIGAVLGLVTFVVCLAPMPPPREPR